MSNVRPEQVRTAALYLPKWATLQEVSVWLEVATGAPWPFVRVIGAGLALNVWLDCGEDTNEAVKQALFKDHPTGFAAELVASGDVKRLLHSPAFGLLSMTAAPDGRLVRLLPPIRFDIADLRVRGDHVRTLALDLTSGVPEGAEEAILQLAGHRILIDDQAAASRLVRAKPGTKIELIREPKWARVGPAPGPAEAPDALAQRSPAPVLQALTGPSAPAPAPLGKTALRHRAASKVDAIWPLIDMALGAASDPGNHSAAWAQLEALARQPVPPVPLVGVTSGGVQYREGGVINTLTRKAFGDRLRRRKAPPPGLR